MDPIFTLKLMEFQYLPRELIGFLLVTQWNSRCAYTSVDSFENRVTLDRLQNLLTSVTDANMNMLRVW